MREPRVDFEGLQSTRHNLDRNVVERLFDIGLRNISSLVVVVFAPDAPMLTCLFEWPHDLPRAPTRAETVESQSLQVPDTSASSVIVRDVRYHLARLLATTIERVSLNDRNAGTSGINVMRTCRHVSGVGEHAR